MKRKIISVCYILIVISLIIVVGLKIKNNNVIKQNEDNIKVYDNNDKIVKNKLIGNTKEKYKT